MKTMLEIHPERRRLLADIPVTWRVLELDGIRTPVLEGGSGRPMVLLHGPGEHIGKWVRVLLELTARYRVIAPDLPGHGDSAVEGHLAADRVVRWLERTIEETCQSRPLLVGHLVGGAIAAQFAVEHGDRVAGLVLCDALGLAPFEPAPEFGIALGEFLAHPDPDTFERLWRRCAFDLERLRDAMGEQWPIFAAYTLERATAPEVRTSMRELMEQFGFVPIPDERLSRIAVPTRLIWGRQNLAVRVEVAWAASARYGWPLEIIDDSGDDPPLEQPERFLRALRTAPSPAAKA